jgi:hypothetical protein
MNPPTTSTKFESAVLWSDPSTGASDGAGLWPGALAVVVTGELPAGFGVAVVAVSVGVTPGTTTPGAVTGAETVGEGAAD